MSATSDHAVVEAREDAVGPAPSAPEGLDGLGELCVLMKLGEIVLKGSNRHLFERRLHNNIRAAAKGLPELKISQRKGIIMLRLPGASDLEVAELAERMCNVMGIVWVHLVRRVAKDLDTITDVAVRSMAERTGTFAVRARRRDKRFPLISSELAAHVGSAVKKAHPHLDVKLKNPDNTVSIEVDKDEAFVFTDGMPGQGGLPVGMSGRALVLMSGGIDSPVAAHRMMRRGLKVDFLHFSGMPFTGPESIYKAYSLVRQLDRFQGGSRLFVVPFGKAQQQIKNSGVERLQIVAQRRLMLKTAEVLADRLGGAALITGDALGQVSSQTLTNITALDDAVDLPILRPLVGMDKTEIMDQARRIGTLAISELPDEDCCTLLTPRQVETAAKIADLRQIEKRLDAEELADYLAGTAQLHKPSYFGGPESMPAGA
ncbi:tRNA uracil 4-sulfurtransferase ThiI [Marinactinospora thermotolerans]|uniref:Probable tRNA sulfurtransferase n=1 Tax=Marinactinospora thermotolerans DSM 45154 TaxID=1122192 RepID=A0A1T4MFP2_9ACTN|nr:tRNA uracil 4-sulfurtransferase ThiI [Marinactinospora thermotolerans]SJZ65608.1 thiamine biosynthesis protein ThiI [Marinactinospora thermotolerans DSM 45154]